MSMRNVRQFWYTRISGHYVPFILAPPGGFGLRPIPHSISNLTSRLIMICHS